MAMSKEMREAFKKKMLEQIAKNNGEVPEGLEYTKSGMALNRIHNNLRRYKLL